jgi:alanine racemase
MPRPIHAIIHQDALRHNLQRLRAAAPGARVWAIVKADAYGHGIERVYEGLRGADGFALLDLAEAEQVRALGWRGPVLLLEGAFEPRDLESCSRLRLWHVVHCDEQIDWLAAHKTHEPQRVFLKLNSGMNRLGFAPERLRAAHARLQALPQVAEVALMTHFSDADASFGIAAQLEVFQRAAEGLPGERSLCNSAAALRCGQDAALRDDWIRPGIAVYGASPDYPAHDAAYWGLQPVMTLATKLLAVQMVQAGGSIGYGSTFTADRAMRVGIAACGYADG